MNSKKKKQLAIDYVSMICGTALMAFACQCIYDPIGLVIGNEGEGVSRLVKEHCDMVASIPMKGDIDSLNASVAMGVLAYEIVRQRRS